MTAVPPLFSVDAYRIEDSVGFLMARGRAMLAKSLDSVLLELDITHAQAAVVMMLASGRYATAADLVRETDVDAASMTRMLDRLQKRLLLERIPRTDDRRQTDLRLTLAGKALAKRLPAIVTDVLNRQFAGFTPEEVGFLKSLLRKLLLTGPALESTRTSAPAS